MARTLQDSRPRRRLSIPPTIEREAEYDTVAHDILPATRMPPHGANDPLAAADVAIGDTASSVSSDPDFAVDTSLVAVHAFALPRLRPAQDEPSASEVGDTEPRSMRELHGRIEKMNSKEMMGWVWDPQTPTERIRLELVENETQLSIVVANQDRPELTQLGCGDGRHGFSIALDDGFLTDGLHVITLRCAATRAEMPGSPVSFEYRRAVSTSGFGVLSTTVNESQSAFRGYIDKVTEDGIIGWIMMSDQPSHRSTVVLKEQRRVLARTIASKFRADLLSAGFGDGYYAFEFKPPRTVSDGQVHMLDVLEEETGTPITKEPIQWCSINTTIAASVWQESAAIGRPAGKIDLATGKGLVMGRIAVGEGRSDVRFTLRCSNGVLSAIPFETVPEEETEAGEGAQWRFKAFCPEIGEAADPQVQLIAEWGEETAELDHVRILAVAGEIERIDEDGHVFGWAIGDGDRILGLEVLIGGAPVCTMLADRYSAFLSMGESLSFDGFRGRLAPSVLRTVVSGARVELRDLDSGETLFSAALGALRSGRENSLSPNSPFEVLVQPSFDTVYDAATVAEFIRKSDIESFVETAYAYLLERRSDYAGFIDFVRKIKSGEETPRTLLASMYLSGERREKGGFLGPFVGEADYPFAEEPERVEQGEKRPRIAATESCRYAHHHS